MGHFSVEIPTSPGSVLSGNQHYNACGERPIDLCETAPTAGVAAEPHDTSPVTAAAKGRCVVVQLSGYPSSAARQSVVRDGDDLECPGHSRTKSHRRVQRLALALYENVRGRIVPDQPAHRSQDFRGVHDRRPMQYPALSLEFSRFLHTPINRQRLDANPLPGFLNPAREL